MYFKISSKIGHVDQYRKRECVKVVYYAFLEIKEKRKLLGESLLSAKNRLCGGIFNFFPSHSPTPLFVLLLQLLCFDYQTKQLGSGLFAKSGKKGSDNAGYYS